MAKKKQVQDKKPSSRLPINLSNPISPFYIRIDSASDFEKRQIEFCLSWVEGNKVRAEGIGAIPDKFTRINGVIDPELVKILPPCNIDNWTGFCFSTMNDAILAREAIKLYFMNKENRILENI